MKKKIKRMNTGMRGKQESEVTTLRPGPLSPDLHTPVVNVAFDKKRVHALMWLLNGDQSIFSRYCIR